MNKEKMMNLAGVLFFYLILVLGVVALNARMEVIGADERIVAFEKWQLLLFFQKNFL